MRPKKTRWIRCEPEERCFRPCCKPLRLLQGVNMTLDEFEALRLADLSGLKQIDAARRMRVSRPTFTRILAAAHTKVADALVNIKAIRIGGGCCRITGRGRMSAAGSRSSTEIRPATRTGSSPPTLSVVRSGRKMAHRSPALAGTLRRITPSAAPARHALWRGGWPSAKTSGDQK